MYGLTDLMLNFNIIDVFRDAYFKEDEIDGKHNYLNTCLDFETNYILSPYAVPDEILSKFPKT